MNQWDRRKLLLPRWLQDELDSTELDRKPDQLADGWRQSIERRGTGKQDDEHCEGRPDRNARHFTEPAPRRRHSVRLFDPKELEDFRAKVGRHHSASADRDRAKIVVKELSDLGPWREPLRCSRAILGKLKTLRRECPNFATVVDHILATMVLYRGAVVLQPLLLDGPAGVGKTYFASRLAEVVGAPFRRVDVGATTASFALVGSDKAYENSQTGCLFDALSSSISCAPVILLDELCKSAPDARYPLPAVLYGLLEPFTAQTFRDASIPQVALDCRYVVWVATSNTTRDIPAPLLNRMRVFEISRPAADEMQEVIRRLAAGIWLATGRRAHAPHIGGDVLDLLVEMPIRSAKAAITEAFAKAVIEDRKRLELRDLPGEALEPRRMGFL
jgi:ATP-dependent Lon protease